MTTAKKMTSSSKENLLYLFDRPTEPLFIEKGDNVSFEIPPDYLVSLITISFTKPLKTVSRQLRRVVSDDNHKIRLYNKYTREYRRNFSSTYRSIVISQ